MLFLAIGSVQARIKKAQGTNSEVFSNMTFNDICDTILNGVKPF